MEELSKKIDSMLEPVLEEEKIYIEALGLEEEYNDIEDIPIDEMEDIDFGGQYGWRISRNYDYIDERKAVLVHLKDLTTIMTESADTKEKHRARKELKVLIADARYIIRHKREDIDEANYIIRHKREDIDEANKVIDVMNNVIDICQTLAEK